MRTDFEVIDGHNEPVIERGAVASVAKVSAKVCLRVPGRARHTTRVFDVKATPGLIMGIADELAEFGAERVLLEFTSDY